MNQAKSLVTEDTKTSKVLICRASKFLLYPLCHPYSGKFRVISQLSQDVVTALAFDCLFVATLDNMEATFSQPSILDVVDPTKI